MENVGGLVRESKIDMSAVGERVDDDGPPRDDVCPICFGNHTLPCKANCGHWFCAGCILQWWDYRAAVQQCNCPLCCCKISKLTLKTSLHVQPEEEVAMIIKRVQRYNHLYAGGFQSLLLKIMVLLLFVTKRILRQLMDPHHFRTNYYLLRYSAIMLASLYEMYKFDFILTGGLGIAQLFELCAVTLAIMLCLVGLYRKVMQRRRVMHLAALQPEHL